jgi:hypothetical protein
MDAQSVALLSDEGVPALSDLRWMPSAALLWSCEMLERALYNARIEQGRTARLCRVGLGLALAYVTNRSQRQ